MKIRPFIENDFPKLVDIYKKSKLDELIYEAQTFQLLPLENDKKRLAELRESDIYVYDDHGVVGYGALFGSEIRSLFVEPSRRSQGIGKQLLQYLLLRAEGTAHLIVVKTNEPAKRLYGKFGFIVVDEFETTYNGMSVRVNKMMCE